MQTEKTMSEEGQLPMSRVVGARMTSAPARLLSKPIVREMLGLAVLCIAAVHYVPGLGAFATWLPSAAAIAYGAAGVVLVYHLGSNPAYAQQLLGRLPIGSEWLLVVAAVPFVVISTGGWLLFGSALLSLMPSGATTTTTHGVSAGAAPLVSGLVTWIARSCVTILVAPVVEETLFRGIVYQRCVRRWGLMRGAVVSSAVFALCHVEWLGHFVVGMTMVVLLNQSQSLWLPIVTHATTNGIAALLELTQVLRVAHHAPTSVAGAPNAAAAPSILMGVSILGAGVILMLGYWRLLLKGRPMRELLTG